MTFNTRQLPARLRMVLGLFVLSVIVFSALRLIFYVYHHDSFASLPFSLTTASFLLGLRFDIQLAALLWLPFLFLSWLPYLNLNRPRRITFPLWKSYWMVVYIAVLVIHVIDLAYFAYQESRLDASILGFTTDLRISLSMILETYPIVIPLLILALGIWVIYRCVDWLLQKPDHETAHTLSFWSRASLYLLTFLIVTALGYGKWSRYPLRWSDAFFTTQYEATQLATNPVLFFGYTFSRRYENWDIKKVERSRREFAWYFNFNEADSLGFQRRIENSNNDREPVNLIVLLLETLPVHKLGVYGNPMGASPFLDSLANQSLHFRRFYVPKFSTAASVFSSMTGLPDVSTVKKSSTRDPRAINQHLLLDDLAGYSKHFFIGGSANWGDIGGFFRNNVRDIAVHEEGGYDVSEVNAWGISDYHLLQVLNTTLAAEEKPFAAVALTAGHHPPYSIPPGVEGFEILQVDEDSLVGFSDAREFNAFRFMDFALAAFFKQAAKQDYHQRTIYALLGDHGFGDSGLPSQQGSLSLKFFQVPLIIYAPGLGLDTAEIFSVTSELDLMPTLFGLMKRNYINTGLGLDVLSQPDSTPHYAFTFTPSTSEYGIVSDDHYLIFHGDGQQYIYDVETGERHNGSPADIEVMRGLGPAFFEMSRYLRYHNPSLSMQPGGQGF